MSKTLEPQPSDVSRGLLHLEMRWEKLLRSWLPLALFSVIWLDLFRLLSTQWEAREQYAYGWFVPFFAVALFIRRWSDRPSPISVSCTSSLLKVAMGIALLALLPMRVIYEINPDWPLFAWSYSLI